MFNLTLLMELEIRTELCLSIFIRAMRLRIAPGDSVELLRRTLSFPIFVKVVWLNAGAKTTLTLLGCSDRMCLSLDTRTDCGTDILEASSNRVPLNVSLMLYQPSSTHCYTPIYNRRQVERDCVGGKTVPPNCHCNYHQRLAINPVAGQELILTSQTRGSTSGQALPVG